MEKKKTKFRFSIRIKTVLMIVLFALVIVETAMVYFSLSSARTNEDNYKRTADNLAGTVAATVDVDEYNVVKGAVKSIFDSLTPEQRVTSEEWGTPEWEEYSARFNSVKELPEYNYLLSTLRGVAEKNTDVDCVYLLYVDQANEYWIYLVDSAKGEDQCPPGCIDYLLEKENAGILEDPTIGLPAYITNTAEYGWLVTSAMPIYEGGTVVGYAGCDISMTRIRSVQANRIVNLFIYLLLSVLLISAIGITVVNFTLIRPIKRLTQAASSYDVDNPEQNHKNFENLKVKLNDEIGDLAKSIVIMENDVYNKVNNLTLTNEKLVQAQELAQKMTNLANKDALTGLRNKIAYFRVEQKLNEDIANGVETHFALVMIDLNYLKSINDDYGHSSGDAALIKLANIISLVFSKSPIFRVGGDEFVVIVRNEEYENIDKLVEEFNQKIEELLKNEKLPFPERISAAIGYEKFDSDKYSNVEDVFRKADRKMYERKHQMKEENNK